MLKKLFLLLMSTALTVSLVACGTGSVETQEDSVVSSEATSEEVQEESSKTESDSTNTETSEDSEATESEGSSDVSLGNVDNSLAEDEDSLVDTYASEFEQLTYTDEETGLSITYNLYLPEGYDESTEYPMVVFIGDSSCAGTDATYSLTQGLGALVWASDEWQSTYPTIVAVPTYPETILDDHDGYTTTEYVELTKRFIDYMTETYSVDTEKIYGTGQSMGCMTTLILASEYPDLYAACMFVDGQWDVTQLEGLEGQTFIYFAAEDDTNAWTGMQEVMNMYDEDSVEYTYAQWDGTWSVDELSEAASELFSENDTNAYFISWAAGTIEVDSSDSSNGTERMMSADNAEMGSSEISEDVELEIDSANTEMSSSDSEGMGRGMQAGGGAGGGNSSSYHMASFDYAYNCIAVAEWLIQQ